MNINDIIIDIENKTDSYERVMAYSDLISHLEYMRNNCSFGHFITPLQNDVNKCILISIQKDIDEQLVIVKDMMKTNIKE